MYISVVTLPVTDYDRAIMFYVNLLGWEKTMDMPMGDERWITIAPKDAKTSLTFEKVDEIGGQSDDPTQQHIRFILECDDVSKLYATLKNRGATFIDEPVQHPWGWWAMLRDSEGNTLGLHSPV